MDYDQTEIAANYDLAPDTARLWDNGGRGELLGSVASAFPRSDTVRR